MTSDNIEDDGFVTIHPAPKRKPVQSWHVGATEFVIYIDGEVVFTFPRKAYEQLAADITAQIALNAKTR